MSVWQVLVNEDDVSESGSENRILRPAEERELNRIKPSPNLRVQPVFMDPGPTRNSAKGRQRNSVLQTGLCLEITGRVRHDRNEPTSLIMNN